MDFHIKRPDGLMFHTAQSAMFYIAVRRNAAACTHIPKIARPVNTSVEPVGGKTIALSIKYAPINEETIIRAQPKTANSRIAPMTPPDRKSTRLNSSHE